MLNIDDLRDRYVKLNGVCPASKLLLAEIEERLALSLPEVFKTICEFFNGGGLNAPPLFSLAGNDPKLNPLSETERLRSAIGLPHRYLFLGEPSESMIIMECSGDGKVMWLDSIDCRRIEAQNFLQRPDVWDSFADFL